MHAEGTDARGTYAASGTDWSGSTAYQSGNSRLGTSTGTSTASGSSTVTTTGADYARTLTGGFGSTATELASAFTGLREAVTTATGSATTRESGVRAGTSYTLTHTRNSTATTAEHANVHAGQYTLTRDGSSDSSLHAVGTETAGSYTLDKTESGYEDSTTRGNRFLGLYTLDGTSGSTSTAVETLMHGSHGSTFTEVLTEDGTASEAGNAHGGDYANHSWGGRSADFVQYGTNADGSYHVTEGSAGTFDRMEIGNRHTGGYSLRETSHTSHGFTLNLDGTETWTLTGTGSDVMTAVEVGDHITGGYTKDETGTDGYTLTQWGTLTGGAFDQTVIGSDGYTTSWAGNHARATHERETVGGGTWTRAGTNAGTGVNDYTLSLSGDELAGHFSASATGTNRYDLVERFTDVSNTEPGVTTPGNVSFHSHGLPFRDPTPEEIALLLDNPQKGMPERDLDLVKPARCTSCHNTYAYSGVPFEEWPEEYRVGARMALMDTPKEEARFGGGVRFGGAVATAAVFIGSSPALLVAAGVWALDQGITGVRDMVTGESHESFGQQLLNSLTDDPTARTVGGVAYDVGPDVYALGRGVWRWWKAAKTKAPVDVTPPAGPGAAGKPAVVIPLQVDGPVCFVAGTPILTPDGSKPVERFRAGDLVLSRDEADPEGEVTVKAVEEIFVRVAPVFRVVVSGREIGTTREHPFHISGVGWRCAHELRPGDLLTPHIESGGVIGVVESVEESGEVATVYNMCVADFHTYFVGSPEWGFSVWAHNACTQAEFEAALVAQGYSQKAAATAWNRFKLGDAANRDVPGLWKYLTDNQGNARPRLNATEADGIVHLVTGPPRGPTGTAPTWFDGGMSPVGGPNPNGLRQRPVNGPTPGEGGVYLKPEGGRTKVGSTDDFAGRYGRSGPDGIEVEIPQTRFGKPAGVDDSAYPWSARAQRRFDEEYVDRMLPPEARYRDPTNPKPPVSQEKWARYRHIFGYGDLPENFGH